MQSAPEAQKGILLEARVQRILFHQGYFAFRNIFIPGQEKWQGGSTPDIDVLGYRFSEDFVPLKVLYDCKSGSSRAVNRILWLQSVARVVQANRAYLVRPNTPSDLKFHALDRHVHFVDHHTLTELESFHVGDSQFYGSANQEFVIVQENLIRSKKKEDVVERVLQTLQRFYWFNPTGAALNKVLGQYEQIASINTIPGVPPRALQWMKGSLVNLFVLGILRLCGEVINLSANERGKILRQRLVSDKIPYNEFTSLVKTTFEYAYTVYAKQAALPMGDYHQIPPPDYSDSLIDLVDRALKRPKLAIAMPRFSELMIFEYVFQDKPIEMALVEDLFRLPYNELLAHYRDYLFFLTGVADCTKNLFKPLFPAN